MNFDDRMRRSFMAEMRVLGILVDDRVQEAVAVQDILTRYGCSIKTRLGLHDCGPDFCSKKGLIVLVLTGQESEWDKLENDLSSVKGVKVQRMLFPL